jgi:chromosome partitioning protein
MIMLTFKGSTELRRVVVLNPKGGSGKTTLAFNLAGYIASTGRKVALVDMDRQGSSMRWLQNRDANHPGIHGISIASTDKKATEDHCVVIPDDIDVAVIDAPAGVTGSELIDYTCGAHAILVPVMPSDLDTHAAARLVSELLLDAQVSRRNGRLGVVANRVNKRTLAYRQLSSFLNRLSIAVVGTLRDTQNYVWAASRGLSIHEMQPHRVSRDLEQWQTVTRWLEGCLAKPLTPRDFLRPTDTKKTKTPGSLRSRLPLAEAAAIALLAVVLFWTMTPQREDITVSPESTVALASFDTAPAERAEPAELSEPVQLAEPAELDLLDAPSTSDEPVVVDPSDGLRQKWQLSGIAKVGDSSVMILSDREGKTIRQINTNDTLDGWTVADAGADYAVFSQNDQEVRLVLNEEAPR